jgi:tetratricopeptide (TPR) repeat protein
LSTGLDAQQQIFANNPDDRRAFESLEEHYFLAGDWEALVTVYRMRLAAPSIEGDDEQRMPLLFRLGQIIEDRLLDGESATEIYWELARLDPSNRPALRQLRGIHERQAQWDMVLQIAELESATEMAAYERAEFDAEQGGYWLDHLGDADEARIAFERSLESDPEYPAALEGLATIHNAAGAHAEAADYYDRLTKRLRGPERAPSWISLGILNAGALDDVERARACFERALDDDPFSVAGVEWLLLIETADERWDAVAQLLETRFDLASGARHRAAIAVEASQIQLNQLQSSAAARAWVDRASELASDEIAVLLAQADVDRAEGDTEQLLATLERLIEVGGPAVPQGALIQAAELYADLGRGEDAVEALRLASQKPSGDDSALLTLQARLLREGGSKRELAETLETLTSLDDGDAPRRQARLLRELALLQEDDLGDEISAQTNWQRAFDLDPHDDDALEALERLHRKASDWDALRAVLESALDARGDEASADLHARLGALLVEVYADEAEGRARFEAALECDVDCTPALVGLRALAEASGDDDLLLDICERQAMQCEDSPEMAALARTCVPILRERRALEPALEWARRWRAICPEEIEALEWCAEFEALLGDPVAEIASRRALARTQTGPERVTNLRRQAELHLRLDDAVAAGAALELAIECEPEDLDTLRSLVDVYRMLGRAEELARCLRQWADTVAIEEQKPILEELATLLHDPLGEIDAAIVVRWRLTDLPDADDDSAERLETLLDVAGRYSEMAQLLDTRRASLGDDSPDALDLDRRRGRLRLDSLGQWEEAAEIFSKLLERHPEDEAIVDDLERALRTGDDAKGLCEFLEQRAEWEADDDRRLAIQFERAMLLDEALGEPIAACDLYASIATEEKGTDHATFALARLETLLESHGHWARLRDLLVSRLEEVKADEVASLRERIAQISHERLGDIAGCADQLEEIAKTTGDRVHVWQRLEEIYRSELERPADWLRVVEAELETEPDPEREYSLRVNVARLLLDDAKRPRGRESGQAIEHYARVLVLDPTQSEAAEALIEHYTSQRDFEACRDVLETRLSHLDERDESERSEFHLRLAELLAVELDDGEAAAAHFESARALLGPEPRIADPLADIYQREERYDDLAALSREVLASSDLESQTPRWRVRLAASQRALGQIEEATLGYRAALLDAPGDREIEDALLEIYEESQEFEPLAELLERRLPYAGIEESVELRMRLARVHADGLDAPTEALDHLEAVLELQPQHRDAFAAALDAAHRIGDPTRLVALFDRALETEMPGAERAGLLEAKGRLIAERLGHPEHALSSLREAISLAPDSRSARGALREQLEKLERWPAVLDCLFVEASHVEGEARVELFERAAQIAWEHVRPDAALPWVERLRREAPQDPTLLRRLGEIHRRAGRFEAALRALDEEICLRPNDADTCRLYVERGGLLERELHAPGRAIVSYQQALAAAGLPAERDPILLELDRLYKLTERPVERARILEERTSRASAENAVDLRQELATLYCVELAHPDLALPSLLRNVEATRDDPQTEMGHLGALDAALRACGRPDAWARVAEREIELIDTHDEIRTRTPIDYQLFVREELARVYDVELGNPDRAIVHLRCVVDGRAGGGQAAQRLLELLRRCGYHGELERRLTAHLESDVGSASDWLALGQLREERMHDLRGAVDAYRRAIEVDATLVEALRGQRRCAERRGDSRTVASALAAELEQTSSTDPHGGAATAHRLGDVYWSMLREPERAIDAYERALEIDPTRLVSLQALTEVCEAGEDPQAIRGLYRREIEILGDDPDQSERAREVWLRLAAMLHPETDSVRESLVAYQAAAAIARLTAPDELRLARLHQSLGDAEAFGIVFGEWCDRPDGDAGIVDHLELTRHFISQGATEAALDRARRACEVDSTCQDAWLERAGLERAAEDFDAAADAFAQAAQRSGLRRAADCYVEAAACLEGRDGERAYGLLEQAVDHDPACFAAHVARVRAAASLENQEETCAAAVRVFDMAEGSELPSDDSIELALLGARAAEKSGEREFARRLFSIVVGNDSEQIDGLEGLANADYELGDFRAARTHLERRIELGGDDPNRGLHLTRIARGLEADGLLDAAWTRYEEAIEAAPNFEDAHEGLIRVLERSARPEEALAGLERWADSECDAGIRAQAAFRAGEHALAMEDRERALRNLERATEYDSKLAAGWALLCDVAAEISPTSDARAFCSLALESIDDEDYSAAIALQAARLAERDGEPAAARDHYSEVVRWDPRCVEAVLAESRLARHAGDWNEADRVLAAFVETHPDPTSPTLAHVYLERGRLLSGPLEGFPEAIDVYERALELQPELHVARTALAGLLMHAPGRAHDALTLHKQILSHSPTNAASLRAIARIAEGRKKPDVADAALSILHALGQAAPNEVAATQERLQFPVHTGPTLDDEVDERVRRIVFTARDELGSVLTPPATDLPQIEDVELAATIDSLREAEGETTAPGFMCLDADERTSVVATLAALALDHDSNGEPFAYRAELEEALSRKNRRKLRRLVEETSLEKIASVDSEAWADEVRALCASQVLGRNGGDLGVVLRAIVLLDTGSTDSEPLESADIGTLVLNSNAARRLLERLTNRLCQRLGARR